MHDLIILLVLPLKRLYNQIDINFMGQQYNGILNKIHVMSKNEKKKQDAYLYTLILRSLIKLKFLKTCMAQLMN